LSVLHVLKKKEFKVIPPLRYRNAQANPRAVSVPFHDRTHEGAKKMSSIIRRSISPMTSRSQKKAFSFFFPIVNRGADPPVDKFNVPIWTPFSQVCDKNTTCLVEPSSSNGANDRVLNETSLAGNSPKKFWPAQAFEKPFGPQIKGKKKEFVFPFSAIARTASTPPGYKDHTIRRKNKSQTIVAGSTARHALLVWSNGLYSKVITACISSAVPLTLLPADAAR